MSDTDIEARHDAEDLRDLLENNRQLRAAAQLVLDFYNLATVDFVKKHGQGVGTREVCDRLRAAMAPTPYGPTFTRRRP